MRSDLSSNDQLIMCMNKPDLEEQNPVSNSSIIKTEALPSDVVTYPRSSSENSLTSWDDNDIIEFGPIKVKPRKKPAPTLATGRRSKYEILSPEEEQKRNVRRARNRAAAERVRISRLNVEQQLQGQIDALEKEEKNLLNNVQILQYEKLRLETRIITHEKMCPIVSVLNPQNDLMSTFTSNNTPAFQQVEKVSDINFDELFSDSSSFIQSQQNNFSNPVTTMMPGDNFDDFFMDS